LRSQLGSSILSQGIRHQFIIVMVAAVVCLVNLGVTGLWDLDEALYTSIAREMSVRGDWVVPTYNTGVFYDKPPLMFWLMMGSFKLLGESEFSARLPAAICAIGTALATYHLARRLFSAEVGFWAGLITTSNIIFTVSARAATVDSALALVTTLAMALFAKGARIGESVQAPPANSPGGLAYLPASWSVYALTGTLLGLAVLAKGPVGFLLPAASLGLFLLVMNGPAAQSVPGTWGWTDQVCTLLWRAGALFSPRKILRVTWAMRPLTVLAFTAMVALPWYVAITWRTDGQWLAQFVTKYNLGPFIKPFLGHRGPFYYHFVVVLIGLFPWSVFLGPTIANAYRALRGRGRDLPSYVLLICWIGVFFGFWSMCSTKLPHYVLPAYPALAILTGCFLHAWIQRAEAATRHVMPIATGIFLGVGVAMLTVLPLVTARYAPGEQVVALLGLVLAVGGGLSWCCLAHGRRGSYMAVFATASVLFMTMLFGWAAVRIDRHQHSRPLMEEIRRDSPAVPQIAGYKYCDASTVYYARGPVAECGDAGKLRAFLDRSPHPYVVTTSDELQDLETQMPGPWRIVARRPRFLAKGEIVVLAPVSAGAIPMYTANAFPAEN
jgi:4-amino-4-deoxy-L-arabinose transferase-like glycosyltransferase